MSDIFISYYHDDQPHAERLAKALEHAGLTVWWDRTIPAGQSFDQVIERALAASRMVVVLWSTGSIGSRWVLNEAEEAAGRNILVPVLIEPDLRIPLAFKRIQAANLVDWDGSDDDAKFVDFVADLKQRLGPSPGVAVHEPAQAPHVSGRVIGGQPSGPTTPMPRRHALGMSLPAFRPSRQRMMPTLLLAGVFLVNYIETAAETSLRQHLGLGEELGNRIAAVFTAMERGVSFESHDVTNWTAVYGYSASYFLLLPVLGVGLAVALWKRRDPEAYRLLCLAIAIDYAISLGFFLFFPVPERWSYADSGAILLSDRWSSSLIQFLRPISGLDNCFPSTHTSFTVILVLVGYVCRVRLRHTLTALGATVILSTFVLGVHWLPDIVAGTAAGVLSVGLACRVTPGGYLRFRDGLIAPRAAVATP